MTAADVATIDAAMRILNAVGKLRGCDVVVYVRHDGRVQFDCENVMGFIADKARAVIDSNGSVPEPGAALLALAERLKG